MKSRLKPAERIVAESEGFLMRNGVPGNFNFFVVSNFRQPKEFALLGFDVKNGAEILMQKMAGMSSLPAIAIPISADLEISRGKVAGLISLKMGDVEWHLANLTLPFCDFISVASEIAKNGNRFLRARGSSDFEWLWKYLPNVPFSAVEKFPGNFRTPPGPVFRLIVLSWNIGGSDPPPQKLAESLSEIFEKFPGIDLLLICLQESCPLTAQNVILNETEPGEIWASSFRKFPCLKGFHSNPPESLVGLTSFFFARPSSAGRISDVSVCSVKTGFAGLTGNKGCVGVRFVLDSRISVAALNVHFSSGDAMAESRKAELSRVTAEANFPGNFFLMENDVILIAGDFNSRSAADGGDELSARMAAEPNFQFEEAPVKFKKTYKLVPGQEGVFVQDRKPGWCDRILHRATEGAEFACKEYDSIPKVVHSDHSPIFGIFEISALQSEEVCEARRLTE